MQPPKHAAVSSPTSTSHGGGRAGDKAAVAPGAATAFCTVAEPASWSRVVIEHRLRLAKSESLDSIAMSPDGQQLFASDNTPDWSGVVALSVRSQHRRRILPFAHPDRDQLLGAAFDGRWLIFTVTHTLTSFDDWTLYAWDSRSGHTRQLARNSFRGGNALSGPILLPAADNGHGAWTQGRPDGSAEVHLYSFATGINKIVAVTHAGPPLFLGHLLLWPASPAPGALSVFHARTVPGLAVTPLPRVLAELRGPEAIVAAGATVAWVDTSVRKLYAWRLGEPQPRLIASQEDGGDVIQNPAIAGQLITWNSSTQTFASDLRTASTTPITPYWGSANAQGGGFYVTYPASKEKTMFPTLNVSVVAPALLPPLPRCQ